MKLNKNIKILVFIGIISLFDCAQKGEFIPPRQYSNTPQGNFDAFWNGVNQNYVFFEETKANWDSIYTVYKDSVKPNTSKTTLFRIFGNMMSHLVDGHQELMAEKSDRDNFEGGTITANNIRELNFDIYRDQNAFNNFITKYLNGSVLGFNSFAEEGEDSEPELLYQVIESRILYVKLFKFGNGLSLYRSKLENERSRISAFLADLQFASNAGAGLIIDLRFNRGGNAREFYEIGSLFVDKDYEWGFSQVRVGTGKNDLSPFMSEKFTKSKLEVYFKNKIVILTNKYSASASEILAISLKEQPNVVVLGDTTFGANGPISDTKEYTGNFVLPNNWKMQLAQRKTFDRNKKNYEGMGLPPDIVLKQDVEAAKNGTDNQLEAAIKLF